MCEGSKGECISEWASEDSVFEGLRERDQVIVVRRIQRKGTKREDDILESMFDCGTFRSWKHGASTWKQR